MQAEGDLGLDSLLDTRGGRVIVQTVKYSTSKGVVEVTFLRQNGEDLEKVVFASSDVPRKQFITAWKALVGDFRYIMHQSEDNDLEVLGIHFKNAGGRATYQLLGGIRVEAGFSSLNSPTMYEPDGDLFEDACLTEEQEKRFTKVAAQAVKYVKGARTALSTIEVEETEEEKAPAE